MEPISPELVLVDPELGRSAAAFWAPPYAVVPRAAASPSNASSWPAPPVAAVLLLASLFLNGLLVARALAPASAPSVVRTVTSPPTAAALLTVSSGAVQQRLVSLLLQEGRRRLPARWIDPATGLPTTNVQVSCRSASPRDVSCLVRHGPAQREGLRVRYSVDAGFIWPSVPRPVQARRPRPHPARHHA